MTRPDHVTVLVPTRGRPLSLTRLAVAVAHTADPRTRVLARVDHDDPALEDYRFRAAGLPNVELHVGIRNRFAASTNELAALVTTEYLAVFGDDVLPETAGWDRMLIEALGGHLGVSFGSDGLEAKHGADLPTHVVLPTEVYDRLGWVVLPELRHLFADNVWRQLGHGLGNFQYVPEAKLTHLHPWAGLAALDQTYQEANDKQKRVLDRAAFEAWRDGEGYQLALRRLEAAF